MHTCFIFAVFCFVLFGLGQRVCVCFFLATPERRRYGIIAQNKSWLAQGLVAFSSKEVSWEMGFIILLCFSVPVMTAKLTIQREGNIQ